MKLKVAGLVWSVVLAAVACDATAQGWVDVTPASYPAEFEPQQGAYDPIRNIHVVIGVRNGVYDSIKYDGASSSFHTSVLSSAFVAPGFYSYAAMTSCYDPNLGGVVAIQSVAPGSGGINYTSVLFDGSNWNLIACPLPTTGQYVIGTTFDASSGRSIWCTGTVTPAALNTPASYGPPAGVLASIPPLGSGQCPTFSQQNFVTQPSGGTARLFYDNSVQRVVLWTQNNILAPGNVGMRAYEWSGSNWQQRFPIWPFNDASYLRAAPSTQTEGALITRYATVNGSMTPRTFRYRNGTITEQFLTSYPPESTSTVYVYDSNRDVFVAFLSGGSIWELNLGPSAQFSTFGAGCLGSRSTPALAPQQGNLPRVGTNFTLQALNLPLAGPVFLAIGASDTLYGPTPLPLNLGPLGAPQCNLLIGIDNLYPTSNVLGAAAWTFPIPNIPGGIFFSQAVVFDPPANTFGLTLSNGGRGVIGI
jgi:hypothetical protein